VKEEQSKKNPDKKGQCRDDALFQKGKTNIEKYENSKNNDPERFIKSLNEDQRKLHDELISFTPKWGEKLLSKDVCAWFLSRKYSVGQVQIAFDVYKQDASEASNKGRSVHSMGGAMVSIIKNGRRPKCPDMQFNRDHAKAVSKKYSWMTVLDKYVKFEAGNFRESLNLDMGKSEFVNQMDKFIRTAQMYG